MSCGLSTEQVATVQNDLVNTKNQRIFPLLLETALFTILTVLIVVSTYVLCSKGLRSRPIRMMLILTMVMYILSAAVWAIDVDAMWNDLNVIIPLDLAGGDAFTPEDDPNTYTVFAEDAITVLIFMLGDSVALWRACVVWGMHKGMLISSVVIIIVQIGSWIIFLLGAAVVSLPATPASIQPLGALTALEVLNPLAFSLTVAANIWPTAMIAYKAWKHRRDVRLYLNNRIRKSVVEAVFLLLVESGVVYSLFWVVFVIVQVFPSGDVVIATFYLGSCATQVPGIYLTLVIVTVALKKSHLEHSLSNVQPGAEVSLPFSVRVPQSTTIRTGETQPSIYVTIPDAQNISDPEIVVVAGESATSLPDEDREHNKPDDKSG